MSTETRQSNRLAQETSPYLLQHCHNPVDWYPWGEEALQRARQEGKPIFLSVGYSACHWCHVMERESFEHPEIASVLNEHFISIKVDREERPDLDEIYMAATNALSGTGGWPMNCFLTPDGKPFFAGTYFPAEDGQGPGFLTLVRELARVWSENRDDLVQQAERVVQRLRRQFKGSGAVLGLEPELLDQAVSQLAGRFDAKNGGFGDSPKFPAPSSLLLLLRYHARSQDPRVLEMITRSLDAMARGGIYDQLGGGFARYAVDEAWRVPHFEKMLYDNAQLAVVYLEGFQATQQPLYRQVAVQTLDYVLREMTSAEGGFYSASDADSEGEEGKYFCWSHEEIMSHLGEVAGQRFCAYYGVLPRGNWEGKNVLYVPQALHQVAAQLGVDAEMLGRELEESRNKLFEARRQRVAPAVDTKVVTAWNGMMIQALAEGFRVLGEERYLEAALRAADFVAGQLTTAEGRLRRSYCQGESRGSGFLEDYAWMAEGLLSLYEAGGRYSDFERARQLVERIQQHFSAEDGGFFETSDDHEELIVRHRSGTDGAQPAAQGVAALALVRMAAHLGRSEMRERGLQVLTSVGKEMRQVAAGFCKYLQALDFALAGPVEVVICAEPRPRSPLVEALALHYLPNRMLAWGTSDRHPRAAGKQSDKPVLFVCQSGVCLEPVLEVADLGAALANLRQHVRFELMPRVEGFATPEATAALAQRSPQAYRELGTTGLKVSQVGFGGYRVDDENLDHQQALREAIEAGVNLLDTSSNYTDGGSERLFGGLLREFRQRRNQLVVVSKIGYVQGSNLDVARARQQIGRPYQDMVAYQDGCWHCIHPEFLADQLERSLMRLSLQTLDVLLLHNPEYYLMDCQQQGRTDRNEVQQEFDRRLESAFQFLEELVSEGKIRFYGVSSNTFAGDSGSLTTTSLSRMVELARKVGGPTHHFKVVQLPMNLLESEPARGFLSEAKAAGVGVLLNRPLNAFVQQTLVRLADFDCEDDSVNLEQSLQQLARAEDEYRQTFGPFIKGEGAEQLFRFADNLRGLDAHLQHLEHWTQLESQRIRPALMEQVEAIDQAMNGPLAEPWGQWRERYLAAFRDVSNDLEELAMARSQQLTDSVRELLPEGSARAQASMSQLAVHVLAGLEGVSSVLVGMRRPEYVEDICSVLSWEACSKSQEVLESLRSWSNPHGVLV